MLSTLDSAECIGPHQVYEIPHSLSHCVFSAALDIHGTEVQSRDLGSKFSMLKNNEDEVVGNATLCVVADASLEIIRSALAH